MRLRPYSTLPLRARLNFEGRYNQLRLRHQPVSAVGPVTEVMHHASLCVEIHPYALIGHQVSSWVSGYLWALDLGVRYEGGVLSRDDHGLFDFSRFEVAGGDQKAQYRRLPVVADERNPTSLAILRNSLSKQVRSARVRRFRLALDQPRWDLTPARDALRRAVLDGYLGSAFREREDRSDFIAIHIRRGADIGASSHPNRWLTVEWYASLIRSLREQAELKGRTVRIYSLGEERDFDLLKREGNIEMRLNGDRDSDFIDLCTAKLLVAAPSSFSFNAAMISNAPALVRAPWWHRVPDEGRWIHIREDGSFNRERLSIALTGPGPRH